MRAALCLLLFILGAAPAPAQELRASLDLARALAAKGRADRDPLALIVAARLRRDASTSRRSEDPDARGLDTPRSLLAEARRLARGERRIASLADDVIATGEKGRARGPLHEIGRLAGGGRETHAPIWFAGGRRAEIYVEATRAVAVAVRAGDGTTLCAESNGGPVAYCWWTPTADDSVAVEIVNQGREPATYRLVTN